MKLTKEVNLAQLDAELGKPGLSLRGDELEAHGSVSDAQLKAAVDAHTPDPNFGKSDDDKLLEAFSKNPNPTAQQTAAAVKAMYRSRR